jgi:hypothetical protein
MILIEFLFAPTVPSAPRPKNIARTTESGSIMKGVDIEARVRDIVVDADGEMVLRLRLGELVEHGLAIAGVNSLEDSP